MDSAAASPKIKHSICVGQKNEPVRLKVRKFTTWFRSSSVAQRKNWGPVHTGPGSTMKYSKPLLANAALQLCYFRHGGPVSASLCQRNVISIVKQLVPKKLEKTLMYLKLCFVWLVLLISTYSYSLMQNNKMHFSIQPKLQYNNLLLWLKIHLNTWKYGHCTIISIVSI